MAAPPTQPVQIADPVLCSRNALRAGLDPLRQGLISHFRDDNHDRSKLKLKGLSPVHYRTQPLTA